MENYSAPEYKKSAFHCPYCNTYSNFSWNQLYAGSAWINLQRGRCTHCEGDVIWLIESETEGVEMIYPRVSNAPMPNKDMPETCRKDYLEAREICNQSPRGAAALLRLCIQKLCIHLGESGKNINNDIAELVKKGLPVQIQQALDVVRVVGNNAVHPGEISVEDDLTLVLNIFQLINMIVDNRITQPKKISELYSSLPSGALNGIKKRDKNSV